MPWSAMHRHFPRRRPSSMATSALPISSGGRATSSCYFDKCALGDPACDLGNLFAQLFRTTIKRPEILRDFPSARASVLRSYIHWSPPNSDLDSRIAWYERATLLRKIHGLLFSKSRDQHPDAVRQRQAEAVQLLGME